MTLKVRILQSLTRLFIILVSLRMSLFSDKMLIFNRCISGLMSNLIKKSWTVSNQHLGFTHCALVHFRGRTNKVAWFDPKSCVGYLCLLSNPKQKCQKSKHPAAKQWKKEKKKFWQDIWFIFHVKVLYFYWQIKWSTYYTEENSERHN